jgi:DNA-binding LacI/PurR family transcriptional regulator
VDQHAALLGQEAAKLAQRAIGQRSAKPARPRHDPIAILLAPTLVVRASTIADP